MTKFEWRVIYHDGATTDEYSEDRPDGQSFLERDPKPVKEVHLRSSRQVYRLCLPRGAEPVFFRRRQIEIAPDGAQSGPRTIAHCIGYAQAGAGVYLFVLDDGGVLLTQDKEALP